MNLPTRAMVPSVLPTGTTDQGLINMWLHDKPTTTQVAYRRATKRFLAFVGVPLSLVTLADFQAFTDDLVATKLKVATQRRIISSIKSLLSFAHNTGYLPFNVGAMVKPPKMEDTLAERILSEPEVARMLALETNPRNHALLSLLYHAGLRISEAAGLRWRNLQQNGETGQVSVFGKGSKSRPVVLDAATWQEVQSLHKGAVPNDFVFASRTRHYTRTQDDGKRLDVVTPGMTSTQMWRIVKAAAKRAGLKATTSPHWLRHAHASHALDNGAPISLVQATLGHSNMSTTGRYTHAKPKESSSKYLKV